MVVPFAGSVPIKAASLVAAGLVKKKNSRQSVRFCAVSLRTTSSCAGCARRSDGFENSANSARKFSTGFASGFRTESTNLPIKVSTGVRPVRK